MTFAFQRSLFMLAFWPCSVRRAYTIYYSQSVCMQMHKRWCKVWPGTFNKPHSIGIVCSPPTKRNGSHGFKCCAFCASALYSRAANVARQTSSCAAAQCRHSGSGSVAAGTRSSAFSFFSYGARSYRMYTGVFVVRSSSVRTLPSGMECSFGAEKLHSSRRTIEAEMNR